LTGYKIGNKKELLKLDADPKITSRGKKKLILGSVLEAEYILLIGNEDELKRVASSQPLEGHSHENVYA
jgi:hypothetical protein